jgi:hypothetical protein
MEAAKNVGMVLLGIALLAAMLVLVVVFINGAVWVSVETYAPHRVGYADRPHGMHFPNSACDHSGKQSRGRCWLPHHLVLAD